jgi:tripartite-type tricarboxylate transporter receptor subunit TctC
MKKAVRRRLWLAAVVAAAPFALFGQASASGQASAQGYPTRNITIVVGFAPGGFIDSLARVVGQKLSQRLGQPVVIENKPGASGNIAHKAVAAAAPDGHTLLAASTSIAINESLFKNKGYAASDLASISIAVTNPEVLAVHPSRPEKTLKEFVEAAKAKGQPITFATAGIGSGSYIAAEYFFRIIAGIPAAHVPYQGGAPAIAAAMGNQVDLVAVAMAGGVAEPIKSGALRGLGVASEKRVAGLEGVPTYAEGGFPGFTASSWGGFFAPAKTSSEIVRRLNGLVNEILKEPDVVARLAPLGLEPIQGSPADAEALFQTEVEMWTKMVTSIGGVGN